MLPFILCIAVFLSDISVHLAIIIQLWKNIRENDDRHTAFMEWDAIGPPKSYRLCIPNQKLHTLRFSSPLR